MGGTTNRRVRSRLTIRKVRFPSTKSISGLGGSSHLARIERNQSEILVQRTFQPATVQAGGRGTGCRRPRQGGFADLAGLNGPYRLKSESFQLWMAAKGTAVEGLEPSRLRPHVTIVIDAGFAPRGPRLGSAFRHTPGLLRLGAGSGVCSFFSPSLGSFHI